MDYNDIVLIAKEYEKIDGHKAYQSQTEMLSLGQETGQNKNVISQIYGKDRFLDITDLNKLPIQLVRIITGYL